MVGTQIAADTLRAECVDEHRRIVLGVLAGQRQPLSLTELTDAIVDHQQATTQGVSEETIATALHHVHLPRLETAGLLEYDAEGHTATPTEELAREDSTLSTILESDPDLSVPLEP